MREPWNIREEPHELEEMRQLIKGLNLRNSLTRRLLEKTGVGSVVEYPSQLGAGLSKKEQYRHVAGLILYYLRDGLGGLTLDDLNEVMAKGGLKPKDFESSEKELDSFFK